MPPPENDATGICPNCRRPVLLAAESCGSCGAMFGPDAWKPIPPGSADAGAENAFEHYVRLNSQDLTNLLRSGLLSDGDRKLVLDELARRGVAVKEDPNPNRIGDERLIKNYANWSPLIILVVLGLRGAGWLVLGWILSRYAASKFIGSTRLEAVNAEKRRFLYFFLYHSIGLVLYAGVLKAFLR